MVKSVKNAIQGMVRKTGYEIVRARKPLIAGTEVISGSFPPYDALFAVGDRKNYFIQDGYEARSSQIHYDDTVNSDGWQDEVYRYGCEVAERERLRKVCDVGCGSGFKLMKYFRNYETVGLEVAETVSALRARYPDRKWLVSDFETQPPEKPDLIICSDVVEHTLNPDLLMNFLQAIGPRFLVISTPDRNLIRLGTHFGPPFNKAHVREWTMREFHAYVSEYFRIVDHFISLPAQATQCLLAVPK